MGDFLWCKLEQRKISLKDRKDEDYQKVAEMHIL